MKTTVLSGFLATLAFAGAAHAQAASAPSTPFTASEQQRSQPQWDNTRSSGAPAAVWDVSMDRGLAALEAKNFSRAEDAFVKGVLRNPQDAEANLYLGATRMELGKWSAARANLEVAAAKLPKHPDPKSRLGVTYAMLGDAAGAHAQRTALVQMADACNATCDLAPYISLGIEMIDKALVKAARG